MKKALFAAAVFALAGAAVFCQDAAAFSPAEISILDGIRFDRDTVALFKPYMKSEIRQMERISVSYDADKNTVSEEKHLLGGVTFDVAPGSAKRIVLDNRKAARGKGYIVFTSEDAFGRGNDSISIIRSASQFDILSYLGTDGINYGITNGQVIAKMKEWNARYPMEIIGAGLDWVDALFAKKPTDMLSLAKEVLELCPDAPGAESGSAEGLADRMRRLNELYLRWD